MSEPVAPPKSEPATRGAKTSEFWVTVIGSIFSLVGQYAGMLPEPWGAIIATILGSSYNVSRGIAKI